MGLLPDGQICGLHMRREWRERFPRHRLQGKTLVSDPGMHHGTCVRHVPWCMSGSLTRGGGENVPGIPGACATRNFTYLARGPLVSQQCIPNRFYTFVSTAIASYKTWCSLRNFNSWNPFRSIVQFEHFTGLCTGMGWRRAYNAKLRTS